MYNAPLNTYASQPWAPREIVKRHSSNILIHIFYCFAWSHFKGQILTLNTYFLVTYSFVFVLTVGIFKTNFIYQIVHGFIHRSYRVEHKLIPFIETFLYFKNLNPHMKSVICKSQLTGTSQTWPPANGQFNLDALHSQYISVSTLFLNTVIETFEHSESVFSCVRFLSTRLNLYIFVYGIILCLEI